MVRFASPATPGIRRVRILPILLGMFVAVSCGTQRSKVTQAPAPKSGQSDIPAGQSGIPARTSSGSAIPVTGKSTPEPAFGDATRMLGLVSFLASDELQGRNTGSEGLDLAANFLIARLSELGVAPYFATYRDTLANVAETAYNIVAVIPGSDPKLRDEFVVLGAHYDHIGIVAAVNGDAIANGANDNATGTATVLELTRYFTQSGPPARSLLIAFFSAEEQGLLGSQHLAEKLHAGGFQLYAMLNFEMTGIPMQDKDYQVYITGYDMSNLAELGNGYAGTSLIGLLPAAKEFNLFQRSDNYTFYKVFGTPSHTFSTFDFTNFAHYHQPGDESGKMDFDHMANLLNALIPVVRGVADSAPGELKSN